MSNKYLFIFCLLSLSLLGASGCAQKMTKQDNVAPPPSSQQAGASQAKIAAPPSGAAKDTVTQPAPEVPKAPTAEETAAAAALLPLPPQEIVDTIKRLTTNPRVRYLSRSSQYDYYVGGLIDAAYDVDKNLLVVTDAPAKDKDAVTCKYSQNGEMISGRKTVVAQEAEECNKLIKELTDYLAR